MITKNSTKSLFSLVVLMMLGLSLAAQFPKIKKPKVTVPKVNTGSSSSSSSGSSRGSGSSSGIVPKNDPSGLFTNVSDNPSAESHRKNAVATLSTLETNFASSAIDYEEFKKLVAKNEKTLGFIKKLEPDANGEKYYEKWDPLKATADVHIKNYDRAKELEYLFDQEFGISDKFETPDPLTFRTDSYGAHKACYCRSYDSKTKTYKEFADAKAEYDNVTGKLTGYSYEYTQGRLKSMAACLENGNKYAFWASNENYDKAVQGYYDTNNQAKPKDVISRCDAYLAGLERIETDYSLNLSADAKSALAAAKVKTLKVKAQSEEYISSGKFQAYLDKMHAEKIAKVFLPKAVRSNSALQAGAVKYVKGEEFSNYADEAAAATTVKSALVTTQPKVVKNDLGIPKYQYEEIWVAYKGKDGKCYRVAVYANYTYKGGGTYDKLPNWAADRPQEMACKNQ